MARITLEIDDSILRELRALQESQGRSMGKITSELLAEALAARTKDGETVAFAWHSQPMGSRVDIADKDAVYAILEIAEYTPSKWSRYSQSK